VVQFVAGARDSSFLQYFETESEPNQTPIHCVPLAFPGGGGGVKRLTTDLIQMPSLRESGAVLFFMANVKKTFTSTLLVACTGKVYGYITLGKASRQRHLKH